jgi:hypothetical protein
MKTSDLLDENLLYDAKFCKKRTNIATAHLEDF